MMKCGRVCDVVISISSGAIRLSCLSVPDRVLSIIPQGNIQSQVIHSFLFYSADIKMETFHSDSAGLLLSGAAHTSGSHPTPIEVCENCPPDCKLFTLTTWKFSFNATFSLNKTLLSQSSNSLLLTLTVPESLQTFI